MKYEIEVALAKMQMSKNEKLISDLVQLKEQLIAGEGVQLCEMSGPAAMSGIRAVIDVLDRSNKVLAKKIKSGVFA